MNSNKRIVYLDVLRVLAIAGVVGIHAFDPLIDTNPNMLYLASFFRFAVPMYVLVSGALLLSRPPEPVIPYLKKRLIRLGLPLLTWTILFGIWGSLSDAAFSWYDYAFRATLFGQPFYLLFVLLGLYCIVPFLKTWLMAATQSEQARGVITALILASLATLVENWLLAKSNILPHFSFTYFITYIGYFLAGYLIHKQNRFRLKTIWLLLGFIGSSLFVAISTHWLMTALGSSPKAYIWYDYLSLPVMVASLCLFALVKQLHPKPLRLVTSISEASLGMYFIHMVIIPFIKPFSTLTAVGIFIIAFFGSYALTLILKKIPGINTMLGCTA